MNTDEFYAEMRARFAFDDDGEATPGDDAVLAIPDGGIEIKQLAHHVTQNLGLGFHVERIAHIEGGDELILVEGTAHKNGVYYLNHEGALGTIEELDAPMESLIEETLDFIEDLEAYAEMSADEKVELFEEEAEWEHVAMDLSALLDALRVLPKSEYFG